MAEESVESLCERAQQAVAQGENDAARQLYLQALGLKPDAPDVHYGLATVCFLLKDLSSAAYHFKEVTRLDPLRASAHINLGAVYNRMDMLDEAIPVLRRGIQLDHNRAEGFYNLGVVYRRNGQTELAITAYREAVRLNPRMADAHYNIANIYMERQQHGMALAHYTQALAVRPTWDKALNGQQQCEEMLNEGQAVFEAQRQSEEANARAGENVPFKDIHLDHARLVNPDVHGLLLTSLHKAAIDSEENTRSFIKVMEREVEPVIKELSNCLLSNLTSVNELDKCLEKFEGAIARMCGVQDQLTETVQRITKVGDRLLRS
jgi:tetratricopeptide (TPR) repeat protein